MSSSPDSAPRPDQLFREGKLTESLARQTELVRRDPGDLAARSFLFALLCFAGDLRRAGLALDAIATQAGKLEVETVTLRSVLAAEAERTRVLCEAGEPLLPPDPPAHALARIRAVAAARVGDASATAKHLDEAAAQTPPVRAVINGAEVAAVRDDDDLLGSVLEVFAGGRYVWLPFETIRSLELSAPRGALDLLWAPARLETSGGIQASVYLPALYEGSAAHPDDAVRLGRTTLWTGLGDEIYRGLGQRLLRGRAADRELDWPLLELRSWSAVPESGTP